MQISFVMLIFLLFSIVFKPIVFGGGANCLRESQQSAEQCIKTQERIVSAKETLTNSCTVCQL